MKNRGDCEVSHGALRRRRPRCRVAKAVAAQLLAGAKPTPENGFKVRLAERTVGAVLAEAKG